jgi:hypothetical protein
MPNSENKRSPVSFFPIAPYFSQDGEHYADGTPTLTSIANAVLAADPETAIFNDIVVTGSLGMPRAMIGIKKARK